MAYPHPSNRRDPSLRRWTLNRYLAAAPSDDGYFSVSGSSGPSERENNCGYSVTMSETGRFRDSPPYIEEPAVSSDSMSEGGWSRDSPPNLNEQTIRGNNTATASAGDVAVCVIVLATALYFASGLFSKETTVNQDVKIVLQNGPGQQLTSLAVNDLLNQVQKLEQEKLEFEIRVRVEIQPAGDATKATDNSETSILGYLWALFKLLFVIGLIQKGLELDLSWVYPAFCQMLARLDSSPPATLTRIS